MTSEALTAEPFVSGLFFGECPRWHDGRLWYSDFFDHAVCSVTPEGARRVEVAFDGEPAGLGWLPDGRLLINFLKRSLSVLIIAVVGIFVVVDRAFASFAAAGTVTGVTIASGLVGIPASLVVFGLNNALLPALVSLCEDSKAFASLFRHSVAHVAFFFGPANLILYFWSAPLIRLLFHSTQFDANSVTVTSALVVAYSIGLFGTALKDLTSNALIALGRESVAMAASIAGLAANLALKWIYFDSNHPTRIATTTSISMWFTAAILIASLSVLMPVRWLQFWREKGWKLAVCNAIFLILCLALRPYSISQSRVLPFAAIAVAGAAYLILTWIFGLYTARPESNTAPRRWRRTFALNQSTK